MSAVTRRHVVLASTVFAATLAATSASALNTSQSTAALTLEDRTAIAEAVAGIGLYADLREWNQVKSYFAARVMTDYTSLFGGEVATSDRDALIAQWQDLLPGFDATQHLITNIVVEGAGNDAVARSHVRATHWIDTRFWTVGASYLHRLVRTPEGWRVSAISIHRLYEEGDRAVLTAAADRVNAAAN
ncbi:MULTISPECIES: nuclear transport factor 2 family protein [unclassified Mesorhizobium]|uniref:nuclear transport factor 2 family protein n=1 Tax=unclassified Mesorhizobium TaxID=325217 RepID=UPI000F762A07|nr:MULTISPECIES: nuclear transport factor 2 family protein [unclassified Mesorhizobium]AZO67918.1 nuclear transport factor 2 family protein [Mesorhizobium sp. M6A.T.Cr.TU.016.01.1.1]RWP50529.1 MAG: nuclear transport factor 2 family protein [Mesorhizobium sp.]RWQ84524.1 MAG: nuclear transport factor 2 family protein [Mesorhizobium sp.]